MQVEMQRVQVFRQCRGRRLQSWNEPVMVSTRGLPSSERHSKVKANKVGGNGCGLSEGGGREEVRLNEGFGTEVEVLVCRCRAVPEPSGAN